MNMHTHPYGSSTTMLEVEGMTCASGVSHVERALKAVPGVTAATVNLATDRAEISGTGLNRFALVKAIKDAGYDVPALPVTLEIEGMTCASCVARVERALTSVPGVTSAVVNLATEQVTITGFSDPGDLIHAIEDAGYAAHAKATAAAPEDDKAAKKAAEEAKLKHDLMIAAVLSFPLFVLEMGAHLFTNVQNAVINGIGLQNSWYLQFALTTAILFGPGKRFSKKASRH